LGGAFSLQEWNNFELLKEEYKTGQIRFYTAVV